MNKIFRVIWSRTLNLWVVVSELAHGRVKASASGKTLSEANAEASLPAFALKPLAAALFNPKLPVVGSAVMFSSLFAMSVNVGYAEIRELGNGSVIAGNGATVSSNNSANSVAIGRGAEVNKNAYFSVVIGQYAKAGDGSKNVTSATVVGDRAESYGWDSVAIGRRSRVSNHWGIAIGNQAHANGTDSLALGQDSFAKDNSIVIGGDARAETEVSGKNVTNSLVIGRNARMHGDYSVAVGQNSRVGTSTTSGHVTGGSAFGEKSRVEAYRGTALGNNSYVKSSDTTDGEDSAAPVAVGYNAQAFGIGSLAVGARAQAQTSNGGEITDATALGNRAVANHTNSVALGANSKTAGANITADFTNRHMTFGNFAGSSTSSTDNRQVKGVVSVGYEGNNGSGGFTRQITNVAAGQISDTSTDAVNGSQLYRVIEKLPRYFSVNASGADETGANSNIANNQATGTNAMAIGIKSQAASHRSFALGYDSRVRTNSEEALAIGAGAEAGSAISNKNAHRSIAIGKEAKSYSGEAVVLGHKAQAGDETRNNTNTNASNYRDGWRSVAIGAFSKSTNEYGIAIGSTTDYNGANPVTAAAKHSIAIGSSASVSSDGESSIALGNKAVVVAGQRPPSNSIAIGTQAKIEGTQADNAVAIGYNSWSGGQSTISIGHNAVTGSSKAIAIGAYSETTASEALALGAYSKTGAPNAIAIGMGGDANSRTQANSSQSVAIGNKALAQHVKAVALGAESQTDGWNSVSSFGLGTGVTVSGFAGTTAHSAVSVGNSSLHRQIRNVAAGRVTATSTDAVNGSQLYAVGVTPITFNGNSGTGIKRSIGQTLTIRGKANSPITVTPKANDNALEIEFDSTHLNLKKYEVKADTAQTGNPIVVSDEENTRTNTKTFKIKLSDAALNALNTVQNNGKITFAASGTGSSGSQAVGLGKQFTLHGSDDITTNIAADGTTGNAKVTFAINKDGTINGAKDSRIVTGSTVKNYVDGVKREIQNSVSQNANLNFSGNQTLINNGSGNATSTDKPTVNLGTQTLSIVGDNTLVKTKAQGQTLTITVDSAELTNQAKAAAKTAVKVKSGTNTTVTEDTRSEAGTMIYKVNVSDTAIRNAAAGANLKYKAANEAAKETALSTGLHFQSGNSNITAETAANGVVKYSLSSALTGIASIVNQQNGAQLSFNADNLSVNNKKITGLQNAGISSTSSDAVTGQQLYTRDEQFNALKAKVGENKLTFAGNSGGDQTINLNGGKLSITGDNTLVKTTSGANGSLSIIIDEAKLAEKTQGAVNVVSANNLITVTPNTTGGVKTFTLTANADKLAQGINLGYKAGNDQTAKTTALSTGLHFKAGTNLTAASGQNGEITYSLASDLTGISSIKGLTDRKAGDITQQNNDYGTGDNLGRAATEGAVRDLAQKLNAGLKFRGNVIGTTDTEVARNLGDMLRIQGEGTLTGNTAANNIQVVANSASHDLTIKLAKNLTNIDSIGNGNSKITFDPNGGGVSITGDVDANIKYQANSDATKARSVSIKNGFDFIGSDNLTVGVTDGQTNNNDGKVTFKLNEALTNITSISGKPADANSPTTKLAFGATEITASGVGANGAAGNAPKLTGLAEGAVSDTSSDAVIGKQLKTALDSIKNALGGNSNVTNGAVTQPTFNLAGVDKTKPTTPAAPTSKNNVGDAITALDGAIGALSDKLGDATITYKSRNPNTPPATGTTTSKAQTTKLSEGLIFEGDKNVLTTAEAGGVAKFALNRKLSGITSITGDADTAEITFTQDNLALNDKKLTGLTNGGISTTSKDAVTGHQLSTLATALGLAPTTANLFDKPSFTAAKTGKGDQTTAYDNVKAAIDGTIGAVNSGLTFGADTGTATRQYLGSTLEVKSGTISTATDFVGTNLKTEYKHDAATGNGTVNIGLAKNLKGIESIAKKDDGTGPKITFGDNKIALEGADEVDFGNANIKAKLAYRANNTPADVANAKKVDLADGLNFLNGKNTTAEVGDNGKIQFHLNEALENITKISGKPTNNTIDKATTNISFGKNTITVGGVAANGTDAVDPTLTGLGIGSISGTSKDAVTGQQLSSLNTALGLTVENDLFKTPSFAAVKSGKGDQTAALTTVKQAIDSSIAAINSGLKFGADVAAQANGTHPNSQYLGSTLQIKTGDVTQGTQQYKGGNLITTYSYNDQTGEGTVTISLNERSTFAEVTGLDNRTVANTPDVAGQTDNYGTGKNVGRAATEGAVRDLADKGLNFKGNDSNNTVARKISETLTIAGEGTIAGTATTNTAANNIRVDATPDQGLLTVKLAKDLVGINSITGLDTSRVAQNGTTATQGYGENGNAGRAATEAAVRALTLNLVGDIDKSTNPANTTASTGSVKLSEQQLNIQGDKGITVIAQNQGFTVSVDNSKLTENITLTYRDNETEDANAKTIDLKKGLVFVNGDNTTATVLDGGKVKFSVNDTLKNIVAISGKPDAGKESTKITLGENLITLSSINNAGNATGTTDPRLTGLGVGHIVADGKDAITGGQLSTLATALGLTPTNSHLFTTPTFAAINKGHLAPNTTGLASNSMKGAVDNLITTVNEGFLFGASAVKTGSQNPTRQNLGTTLKVVEGDLTSTGNTHFKGKNLKTEYGYDNGTGTVSVGLSETPEFKAVDLKGTDNVTDTTTTIDASGVKVKDTNNPAKTLAELSKDKLEIVTGTDNGTDNKLVIGKDGTTANAKGAITGLTERSVAANQDYGQGSNAGRAATEGAVRALSDAGLNFLGNDNDESKKVARKVGETLTIAGEGTIEGDKDSNTAADNIRVDTDNNAGKLILKLANALKHINSIESDEIPNSGGSSFRLAKASGLNLKKVDNGTTTESNTTDAGLTAKKTTADGVQDLGVSTTGLTLQDIAGADPNAADALTKKAALSINNLHFKQSNSPADGAKGNDGEANYGLTEASIKDKDNNAFTANATSVTLQDNNAENKAVLSKTGVETSNADYTSNLGATSLVFSKTVAAGAQPTDQTSATLDRTSLEFKATDGTSVIKLNSTDKTAKIGNITINGSDTKLVNVADVIKLDGANNKITIATGTDKAIEIGKDGTLDTGKMMGLTARNAVDNAADYGLGDNAGRAATESAVKTLSDKLRGAASPFEYVTLTKDPATNGKALEKGQDGKFYLADELKNATWNANEGKYKKTDGTDLTANTDPVIIRVREEPEASGLDKRLQVGRLSSGLGLGNYGTDAAERDTTPMKFDSMEKGDNAKNGIVAVRKAAEKLYALDGDELDRAVTTGDLQAVAVSGLTFKGNATAPEVHRKLSDTLVIKGEEDANNALAQDAATASGNIRVDVDENNNALVVKLADALRHMVSIASDPIATDADGKSFELSKDNGLNLKQKAGDTTTENAITDAGLAAKKTTATAIEKVDVNTAGLRVAHRVGTDENAGQLNKADLVKDKLSFEESGGTKDRTAEYGLDKANITDKDKNVFEATAQAVRLQDKDANKAELTKAGLTTANADQTSTLGADSLVFANKGVGDAEPADKTSATLNRTSLEFKATDGISVIKLDGTNKTAKIGNVEIKGNDEKLVNVADVIKLDGANNKITLDVGGNKSLEIAKDVDGSGKIMGLTVRNAVDNAADYGLDANAGRAATEGSVKALSDQLRSASSPFEYANEDGEQLVKGKDGKFYKAAELDTAKWDEASKKYKKADDSEVEEYTGKVVLQARDERRLVTRIESGIGLGNYGAATGATGSAAYNISATGSDLNSVLSAVRDATTTLYSLSGKALDRVVTVGDLQAVALAGLTFKGNAADKEVHRKLGDSLSIKGEGALAQDAPTASGNIRVDVNDKDLILKLAKAIKEIDSIESAEPENGGSGFKLDKNDGLTLTKKAADGTPTTNEITPEGATLTGADGATNVTNADGSTLTAPDGATNVTNAEGNALTNAAGATNVTNAEGSQLTAVDGTESATTAKGTTITGPAGADGKNASAAYGLDGASVTDAAGNTASVAPTEIKVADAAGKNTTTIGNDKISITKGKDGTNGKDGVDLTAENIKFSSTDPADKSTATLGKDNLTFTNKAGKETIRIDGENGTISGIKSDTKFIAAPQLDGKALKQANDGKWYLADDVSDKGEPEAGKNPAILMADDGKYYKADAQGQPDKTTTAVEVGKGGLVDFANSDASAVATVGDLQGLGFVVSTSDKSGGTETYKDQVRHGNQLNVTGSDDGLVSVKGKTDENGKRELVVDIKRGVIVPQGERFAVDKNGKPLVKVGEGDTATYYRPEDLGTDGQPLAGKQPVAADQVATQADGNGFVTGNQVGAALSKSGFIVGKGDAETMDKDPTKQNRDERINPEDEIRFADGKNSIVTMTTKDDIDATGNKKTVTTVRVDVDLPIKDKYTIPELDPATGKPKIDPVTGKPLVKELEKGRDGNLYNPEDLNEFGKPLAGRKPVLEKSPTDDKFYKPELLDPTTKAPLADATPTKLKRDMDLEGDKYESNPANASIDGSKDQIKPSTGGVNINNVGWANEPDQAVNKDQLDQTVAKSGFLVKENGEAVKVNKSNDLGAEKVTPNDAVNFANGGNTVVNVETTRDENGVDTTNISVHLTGLPMTYTAKVGGKDVPITKVVTKDGETKFYAVGADGKPVLTNADGSSAEIPAGALANAGMAMSKPSNAPNEVSKDPVRISNVAAATESLTANPNFETKDIGGKIYDARDVENIYEVRESSEVLVKIDEDFYKPEDVEIKMGKVVPKANADKVSEVVDVNGLVYAKDNVNVIGEKRKPGAKALVKVGDDYYRSSDVGADGKVKDYAIAVNKERAVEAKAYEGLANLEKAQGSDVLTVDDARRMGFVIGTRNTDEKAKAPMYAGKVQNANKLELVGANNVEVIGEDRDDKHQLTIRMVDNPEFESIQLSTKDSAGNPVLGTKLSTDTQGNLRLSKGNTNAPVVVSGVAAGRVAEDSDEAINGSQFYSLQSLVEKGWELEIGVVEGTNGITNNAPAARVQMDTKVVLNAGQNIMLEQSDRVINISTVPNPTFDSLFVRPNGEVNLGGNRIQNVAAPQADTDAVNRGYVNRLISDTNLRMQRMDRTLRAGIAGSTALAFLQTPSIAGKQRVSVAVGGYGGEGALAVGYSGNSDNNRITVRLGVSINTHRDVNYGGSVGYQW